MTQNNKKLRNKIILRQVKKKFDYEFYEHDLHYLGDRSHSK